MRRCIRQWTVLSIVLLSMTSAALAQSAKEDHSAPASPQASPGDAEQTVALLLTAPEITSLSELAGRKVAIDEPSSASNDAARRKLSAIVNAELTDGRAKALDRLVNGEVSAAVLALSYPEAAELSSEIAGFKVFRIPLVDRPLKAGSAPADAAAPEVRAAAVDPDVTGSIDGQSRERIRVATVIAEHVMTLRDAEKKAANSPNVGEPSVAIVVAGPDIKSVSDLSGKIIAIDDRHMNLHTRIQAAFVVAGATDSLLTASETKAADRLLSGKVSAAVLTLVYPETGFSAIEGYSVFRVSLEHRAMKARM